MAKVTIVIEDDTLDGQAVMNTGAEFEPELKAGEVPTMAQRAALLMLNALEKATHAPGEEALEADIVDQADPVDGEEVGP